MRRPVVAVSLRDLCLQRKVLMLSDTNKPHEDFKFCPFLRASSKTQEDGGRREKKESRVQEKGESLGVTSKTH